MEENKITQVTNIKKVDSQKVEMYILSNSKYFPAEKLTYLKNKMLEMDKDAFDSILTVNLKSVQTTLLVSIFLGNLGIDRFMIGDIGMGFLKLLTCGLCGILWLYDLFTISSRVKTINFENINKLL